MQKSTVPFMPSALMMVSSSMREPRTSRIATMITFSLLFSLHCHSQDDYSFKLAARLDSIRSLDNFNNTVAFYDDTLSHGMGFPNWTATQHFYEDEMVWFKHCLYVAVANSTGKRPDTSTEDWQLVHGPHPFLFLRDTARTEDLKELLNSAHPFIRIYAFAALAKRGHANLFPIVVENLSDTSRITYFTDDYGEDGYAADLMLWYSIPSFTPAQKDTLKKLVLTQYTHLNTLDIILLFHKPDVDEYKYVKAIVQQGIGEEFGFVALAKYKRDEDIELIRSGFRADDSYKGFFFLAIESFPHKSFMHDLIQFSKGKGSYMAENTYFIRALAAYKNRDCLEILADYARQKVESNINPDAAAFVKERRLIRIYQALKKHYTPMYDHLINEIKGTVGNTIEHKTSEDNWFDNDPWNY
jgi:hypothetical protein